MVPDTFPAFSAFISYSHADRAYGVQAKEVLAQAGIETFLAHEDLEVSEEWRERIISELKRCDIFVPLLSKNFLVSKWAPQEIGFIVSRPQVTIAPLSIDGTISFGFISHIQSRQIKVHEGISTRILVEPLAQRVPRKILPGLIRVAGNANTYREAERLMAQIAPYFSQLSPEEAQTLAEVSTDNNQIWEAGRCRREYLPQLITLQTDQIEPKTLEALTYQINHNERYHD